MAPIRKLQTSLIVSALFFVLASGVDAQTIYTPTLIRTINTFSWTPPSPDACGIVWLPQTNRFLVTDSEVDEMTIYKGANVYEVTLDGTVVKTHTTVGFSDEPTDIAVDSANSMYYFTDDNQKAVNAVNLGSDRLFRTTDDTVTQIFTSQYGCTDPEGIAYSANRLFLACGADAKVVTVSLGLDGILGGTDDTTASFSTVPLNQADPEGIEYNPGGSPSLPPSLFIVSTKGDYVAETTLNGTLIRNIDIRPFNVVTPSGLEYAPSSINPQVKSLYIAARGLDNDPYPTENDGKIYEFSLSSTPPLKEILLSWLGAALDRNGDNKVNSLDFALLAGPSPSSPTPTPTPTPSGPTPTLPPSVNTGGIWRNRVELQALPITGNSGCDTRCSNAWNALKSAADSTPVAPNLGDQSETTNNITLAKALVWAKTGSESYRSQVRTLLGQVIGTENNSGNRALSVGRMLQAYVIAADIIDLKTYDPSFDSGTWRPWLERMVGANGQTAKIFGDGRSLWDCSENMAPDNWGTHCLAALGVADIYLGDYSNTSGLGRVVRDYRGFIGDDPSYVNWSSWGSSWSTWMQGWSSSNSYPAPPINPQGATKEGHNVDGVSVVDQGRCNGQRFGWPPCYTLYSWDFQQGSVVLAEVLKRKGYDAWSWSNQAQKRSVEWMFYAGDGKTSWDTQSSSESYPGYYSFILDIVDYNLGRTTNCFGRPSPKRYYGTNLGWTAWTHQRHCDSYLNPND